MKKLLIIPLLFLLSCASQKKVMDSYMGKQINIAIVNWGPANRIDSDGGSGRVYTWYGNPYQLYQTYYYPVRMFFVDSKGEIYSWRTNHYTQPPSQIQMSIIR